jgi:hypothetical protein
LYFVGIYGYETVDFEKEEADMHKKITTMNKGLQNTTFVHKPPRLI